MSPAIARRVVQTFQKPLQNPADPVLTQRELAVLTLLRAGRGYKGTAADLGCSVDTVRTHIRNIYQKLQVHSLIEALAKTRR
jgi:DNA-binding NarL/FixJ family response regulator